MRPPVRLNLLQPRRSRRISIGWRRILRPLLVVAVIAATLTAGARWLTGERLERTADDSWRLACEADLKQVPQIQREELRRVVQLARQVEDLSWSKEWAPLVESPIGSLIVPREELQGLQLRLEQLRTSLRGELERQHGRLEEIAREQPAARAATLRLLAFGRWRLNGGAYDPSVRYYEERIGEIERRPTHTPVPTATSTPTQTPPPRRGKNNRRAR